MKQFYFKKEITMIIFFLILISFSIVNVIHTWPYLKKQSFTSIANTIEESEGIMKEKLYQKYTFVEGYGYLQKLLLKKEFNGFEIVKDDNNSLYLESYEEKAADLTAFNQKLKRFQQSLQKQGTTMISFIIPDKVLEKKVNFPKGYPYNYANETLDAYKQALEDNKIAYIDMRKIVEDSPLTHQQLFYKSDHHWRTETAFMVYQQLINRLKVDYGLDVDPTKELSKKENYNFITYPSIFLGSIGRKSGASYAQADDFTFIYPKYRTNFTMEWMLEGSSFTKNGRFETTLANPSYLNHTKVYDEKSDTYSMYLDGNAAYTSILNHDAPNSMRVLFLKDSYSLPLAAFFANHVLQVDLIDPRYTSEKLEKILNEHTYDLVFCALSASSLQENYLPTY